MDSRGTVTDDDGCEGDVSESDHEDAASQYEGEVEPVEEAGEDADTSDYEATELAEAVIASRDIKVKRLLNAKADPNTKDGCGISPLQRAVWEDESDLSIVQMLLDAKADPMVSNDANETLMTDAVRGGDQNIVQALLAAGADPNIVEQNNLRKKMIGVAVDSKNLAIIALLLSQPKIDIQGFHKVILDFLCSYSFQSKSESFQSKCGVITSLEKLFFLSKKGEEQKKTKKAYNAKYKELIGCSFLSVSSMPKRPRELGEYIPSKNTKKEIKPEKNKLEVVRFGKT